MTTESEHDLKAGRRQVARSRGALSGLLLMVLGAWAALVPFIGPYFNFGFSPRPNDAFHWTAGRGWLEVLPGVVAVLGGLLVLVSSSRLMTLFGGWIAALAGAWLVVGVPLSRVLHLHAGGPDPSLRLGLMALERLLYFYGIGAAILLIAGIALGRLSVHSVRDVKAAESRAELQAAEERRLAEEHRLAEERRIAEERRADEERARADEQRRADEERARADEHARQQAEPTPVTHPNTTGQPAAYPDAPPQNVPPQNVPPQNVPPQGHLPDAPPAGGYAPPQAPAGSEGYLGHHGGAAQQPPPPGATPIDDRR